MEGQRMRRSNTTDPKVAVEVEDEVGRSCRALWLDSTKPLPFLGHGIHPGAHRFLDYSASLRPRPAPP